MLSETTGVSNSENFSKSGPRCTRDLCQVLGDGGIELIKKKKPKPHATVMISKNVASVTC